MTELSFLLCFLAPVFRNPGFCCNSKMPSLGIMSLIFFFFNDTATTEIYTLPPHDALPICVPQRRAGPFGDGGGKPRLSFAEERAGRSEEHTPGLQSPDHIVCRLLLCK